MQPKKIIKPESDNIREKLNAPERKVIKQSVLSLNLDQETIKAISIPKPVLLYHSKWGHSSLYYGKIQIPEATLDTLVWTSPRETQKNIINLRDLASGRLLRDEEAHEFLLTFIKPKSDINLEHILILSYFDILCLVFEDKINYSRWSLALGQIMKGLSNQLVIEESKVALPTKNNESSYTAEQYGAIFDINEPEPPNESWRDIKVTFVKEENSHTEYLIYDRSQKNLYESVEEVLFSVERFLDIVNYNIVKSYLFDITRIEYTNRILDLSAFKQIRELNYLDFSFKRKDNAIIRNKYKDLDGNEIGNQIIKLMKVYDSHDIGDQMADSLNLILLQRLSISLDIHQVAYEHELMSMRRSLEAQKVIEEKKVPPKKSANVSEVEKRITDIINQKKEEDTPSTKSFFRDACECIIA